jgi:putative transposase
MYAMDLRRNAIIGWPIETIDSQSEDTLDESDAKSTLEKKYRLERVLYVDAPNNEIWAIDVHDKKAFPIFYKYDYLKSSVLADRARIVVNYEPYPMIVLPDEELGEDFAAEIRYRDESWELIKPLLEIEIHKLFNRKTRGKLIREIEARTGRQRNKIIFQLRRYWQRGCVKNALFSDRYKCGRGEHQAGEAKRGRPTIEKDERGSSTGVNVTPEDIEKFKDGIKKHVHIHDPKDLSLAWKLIKEEFYSTGTFHIKEKEEGQILVPELLPADQIPTVEQFKYHYYKRRDRGKEVIAQFGQDEYDRNHRPVLNTSLEEGPRPGALYQIDATIGDIYLICDFDRNRLIGRPVIYIVIDTFSRFIVGFAVTLEGPNWMSARLALMDAFMKYGYCEALIGDNGEIKGYNANSLVDPLKIRVVNAKAGRPDLKPIVERNFRTIKGKYIKFVPGAVHPRRTIRDPDYRLEARLSLHGFRKLFGKCVNHYNNNHHLEDYPMSLDMIARKVKPIPSHLWEYGIEHLSGLLGSVEDVRKLQLALLPKGKASVHQGKGLYYKGLLYVCERGIREGWFERHKGASRRSFAIAEEPIVDKIHLCLNRGRDFEECVLTEACRTFEGKDWYEVRDYFALKNIEKKQSQTEIQQSDAEFHADINNLIAQEIEATERALKVANLSKRAQLSGIRDNREQIKKFERKHGPIGPDNMPGKSVANEAVVSEVSGRRLDKAPMPDAYVPPAQPIDEIRAARERARHKND